MVGRPLPKLDHHQQWWPLDSSRAGPPLSPVPRRNSCLKRKTDSWLCFLFFDKVSSRIHLQPHAQMEATFSWRIRTWPYSIPITYQFKMRSFTVLLYSNERFYCREESEAPKNSSETIRDKTLTTLVKVDKHYLSCETTEGYVFSAWWLIQEAQSRLCLSFAVPKLSPE